MFAFIDSVLDRTIVLSFDRLGFLRHGLRFDPSDLDVDLAGRVCLVTGASGGLGRAAAAGLARLGAEVWVIGRNPERTTIAAEAIRGQSQEGSVHAEVVDVADLEAIRAFCDRFPRPRVDVLINNAGVLPDGFQQTRDGLELTLATNLVGPFALTMRLLPRLAMSDDGRVVMVSSGGMYSQTLVVRELAPMPGTPFDGVTAYARTKRAEVVLTELWAERLRHLPITFSAMHPGWADTPGVRTSLPRFWAITRWALRSPEEGADTIVWLAATRRLNGQSGKFWFDRRSVDTHLFSRTRESAEEREVLWHALLAWSRLPAEAVEQLSAQD